MFYFYSQVDKTARINSVHKYFIIITLLYWIFLSSVLTFVYFYQFRILILFAHCHTNSEKAITIRVTHFVLSFNVLVIEIARACLYETNCNFIAFNFTYGQHVISIRETRTFSRTLQYLSSLQSWQFCLQWNLHVQSLATELNVLMSNMMGQLTEYSIVSVKMVNDNCLGNHSIILSLSKNL